MSVAASPLRVRVNLLPAAYELRCRRGVRLRRWVAAGVLVIGLQVAAAVVLRQMGSQARDLQRGLIGAQHQEITLRQRLDTMTTREGELERQLSLAEQLNRKHRWSELLVRVTACLPNTVVLTRCESDPAKSSTAGASTAVVRSTGGKPGGAGESTDVAGGLVISGVAMDHDSVASFLRNLNGKGRVGRCSLESSMRQPYLKGEGVFFTVRTKW